MDFERAVRLLATHLPDANEHSKKPLLFHSLRVGIHLYQNGYSADLVLAGLLHDAIEWSDLTAQNLQDEFGEHVTKLVLACTKDDTIVEPTAKIEELIKRCIQTGEDALIVKTADILDSFQWYTSQKNQEELEYCRRNADAIFKFKPADYRDKIFTELKSWQNQVQFISHKDAWAQREMN